jgi:hypothetical protein
MYANRSKSIGLIWLLAFSNFVTSRQRVYEKLEKKPVRSFRDRPKTLLVRHFVAQSEMSSLLCRVIVVNVEHHMLLLSIGHSLVDRAE